VSNQRAIKEGEMSIDGEQEEHAPQPGMTPEDPEAPEEVEESIERGADDDDDNEGNDDDD
jgi:hypothetical protein